MAGTLGPMPAADIRNIGRFTKARPQIFAFSGVFGVPSAWIDGLMNQEHCKPLSGADPGYFDISTTMEAVRLRACDSLGFPRRRGRQ